MTRKAKLWIGVTIFIVLMFNYGMVAYPMYSRIKSLQVKEKSIIFAKTPDDEYFLEVFKQERRKLEDKLKAANMLAASLTLIIISWTAFSMVVHKKK